MSKNANIRRKVRQKGERITKLKNWSKKKMTDQKHERNTLRVKNGANLRTKRAIEDKKSAKQARTILAVVGGRKEEKNDVSLHFLPPRGV